MEFNSKAPQVRKHNTSVDLQLFQVILNHYGVLEVTISSLNCNHLGKHPTWSTIQALEMLTRTLT